MGVLYFDFVYFFGGLGSILLSFRLCFLASRSLIFLIHLFASSIQRSPVIPDRRITLHELLLI